MDELPIITCDDDWLDMRIEERGLIVGRLDAVTASGMLLITYPDWRQVVVPIEPYDASEQGANRARLLPIKPRDRVRLIVTRGEDGLITSWADVAQIEIAD